MCNSTLSLSETGSQVGSQVDGSHMAALRLASHGGRKALQRHHLFFFLLHMISFTLLNDNIMCFMASVHSPQPFIFMSQLMIEFILSYFCRGEHSYP
jgi:hypothetical protein